MRLILAMYLSLISLATSAGVVEFPEGTTEECKNFLKVLPAQYKFGWIKVPEDYDHPKGKKISVFWYSKRSESDKPVIFFNGGPIGTDRYSYQLQAPMESRFKLGIIYMDQRGTGCSTIPPAIVDKHTAYISGLYASEGIARDAESVRVKLLGAKKKWTAFGQSYGGVILARYISLFPKSLVAAHSDAGMAGTNFSDFFYYRMKSYLRQLNYFKKNYPDGLVKLQEFKDKFTPDMCIEAYDSKLCGKDIYYVIVDDLLFTPSTWLSLYDLISQQDGCDECVFNSDGSLSEIYVKKFKEENDGTLRYFFSKSFRLRAAATWRQDLKMGSHSGDFAKDCNEAYARLRQDGIEVENMLANHCRFQIVSHDEDYLETLSKTLALTPVKKTMTWKDTLAVLKENPTLQYHLYSGEFDGGDNDNGLAGTMAKALPNQIHHTHFMDGDHWSYLNHSLIWQKMSGKNLTLENSQVSFSANGSDQVSYAQATEQSVKLLKKGSIVGAAVDIGFGDKELDEETKARLKGNIAIVRRGKVSFVEKLKIALSGGATAVVVGNNNLFLGRPSAPAGIDNGLTIPVMMISTLEYDQLLKVLPVDLKLSLAPEN